MSRFNIQLTVLIALLALIIAPVIPTIPEALATTAPQRVQLDDGDGSLILTRAQDAHSVPGLSRLGALEELLGYVPDADVFVPDPLSLVLDQRLLRASVRRLVPLDQRMGRIHGNDDRNRVKKTKVYPASAATFIFVETGETGARGTPEASLCSGGLVGAANLVITAAHCVYDYEGGRWYDDWFVYPGAKSDSNTPYGVCGWRRVYVHKKWRTGNPQFDVAAIVLDCDVGDQTGWYGVRASSGSGYISGTHLIHQYPGDKPLATQWQDWGSWAFVDGARRTAYYEIDTAGGSSGAPVIQRQPDGTYYTNATHAYGGDDYNSGAMWWKQVWKKVLLKAYSWATRAPR